MLYSDNRFRLSIFLSLLQQIALAFSTYFIALAGRNAMTGDIQATLRSITLFLLLALLAYALSSAVSILTSTLQSRYWLKYGRTFYEQLENSQQFSNRDNRERAINWLTTEAPNTLNEVALNVLQSVTVYGNLIFSLIVFGITLGTELTGIIVATLILSAGLTSRLRTRVADMARVLQDSRLTVSLGYRSLWDTAFFGTPRHQLLSREAQKTKMKHHADHQLSYALTEQLMASLPVFLAVPGMIAILYGDESLTLTRLGALVAVLPRTLQILGSVHALGILNSKLLLARAKLDNLQSFHSTLKKQILEEQIRFGAIQVESPLPTNQMTLVSLREQIIRKELTHGRFTLSGPNGSGKSTFLRLIKSDRPDALLISPEVYLFSPEVVGSTGEAKHSEVRIALQDPAEILLLDEWDANLDPVRMHTLSDEIMQASRSRIILEVRHRKS